MVPKLRHSNRVSMIFLAVMCVFMISCSQKYSTLEEYLQSNPMPDTFTNMTLNGGDINMSMNPEVSENMIILKMVSDRTIFGEDESVNAGIRNELDQYFNSADAQSSLNASIDRLAAASGLDATLISVRYEMYNPDSGICSYSYLYSKQ